MHDIYTPEWSQSRNFSQEIYPSEPRALSISNPHVARLLERTLDRRILKHLDLWDEVLGLPAVPCAFKERKNVFPVSDQENDHIFMSLRVILYPSV